MPLSSITRLNTHTLLSQPSYFLYSVLKHPTVEKIINISMLCFKPCSSLYFCGYGMKEIYWDYLRKNKIEIEKSERINKCAKAIIPSKDYPLTHGLVYVGAGICSAFEALHAFSLLNCDKLLKTLGTMSNGCFLLANLLALEENISLYEAAKEEKGYERKKEMRTSAILGIINNLGYVTATVAALYSLSTAMTLLCAGLAAITGALKVLYDFYIDYGEMINSTITRFAIIPQ